MAGYSLHIGLNSVHPDHYEGWDGALNGCEYDTESMTLLAHESGFEIMGQLLTEEATRDNVRNMIGQAAATCEAGDLFMITYSGHGGQIPDRLEIGDRGTDETWCLYDGQLLDDELLLAWLNFAEGVRILIISDSCHSGGMERYLIAGGSVDAATGSGLSVRQVPARELQRTYFANREFYENIQAEVREARGDDSDASLESKVKASALLLAACQDHEYAYENAFGGLFTASLISLWDFGRYAGNYDQFRAQILAQMRPDQHPLVKVFGKSMHGFPEQRPFTIEVPRVHAG